MVVSFAGAALARPRLTWWTCNNSALDRPFPTVLGRWHVKKSCRERNGRERRGRAVRGKLILAPTIAHTFSETLCRKTASANLLVFVHSLEQTQTRDFRLSRKA